MKRQASYRWRLREMMAARDVFTATELVPLLQERGIDHLSASQVHRLVTGTPERLSLPVLAALCDILEVTPADLVVTTAANVTARKAVQRRLLRQYTTWHLLPWPRRRPRPRQQ